MTKNAIIYLFNSKTTLIHVAQVKQGLWAVAGFRVPVAFYSCLIVDVSPEFFFGPEKSRIYPNPEFGISGSGSGEFFSFRVRAEFGTFSRIPKTE